MPTDPRVREAIDLFMARIRHDLDAHLHGLSSDLLRLVQEREDTWRAETDRLVAEARADADRTLRSRMETLRGEPRAIRLAGPDATPNGGRQGRIESLDRVLAVVRRLDDATTLTSILDVLMTGAVAETSRVAILLVDADVLRPWRHVGFSAHAAPVSMPLAQSRCVTAVVALQQTSFVPSSVEGHDPASPAFMRVPAGHTGLVAPIVVGSEVVAVLYADDADRPTEQEEAPAWTEEVELLVRHASLRLENVTSMQTVEQLTKPA